MDKQTESLARQEFEKWLRSQPHVLNVGVSESGSYVLREDRIAWAAWKASRESLVVDIDWPEANDDHWKDGEEGAYAQGYEVGKDLTAIKVKQSLRAIGIRIKGEGV